MESGNDESSMLKLGPIRDFLINQGGTAESTIPHLKS